MFDRSLAVCYTICMSKNPVHYRTCVCNINYHVVWSVKYRKKIITPDVEAFLKDIVQAMGSSTGGMDPPPSRREPCSGCSAI